MKKRSKLIFLLLFVLCVVTYGCSVEKEVDIESLSKYGDEMIENYPNISDYSVKLDQAHVRFMIHFDVDYSIDLEDQISEILIETQSLFMNEDVQSEFLEVHRSNYGSEAPTVDSMVNYPSIYINFDFNNKDADFFYESSYKKFDKESKIEEIDKYQTWFGPIYYIND